MLTVWCLNVWGTRLFVSFLLFMNLHCFIYLLKKQEYLRRQSFLWLLLQLNISHFNIHGNCKYTLPKEFFARRKKWRAGDKTVVKAIYCCLNIISLVGLEWWYLQLWKKNWAGGRIKGCWFMFFATSNNECCVDIRGTKQPFFSGAYSYWARKAILNWIV